MHNVVQVVQAVKTRVCSSVLSHSWISPEKMPFVVEERGKKNVVPVRLLSRERLVCSISVALLTVLPMYSTRVTATGGSVLLHEESCALTALCSPKIPSWVAPLSPTMHNVRSMRAWRRRKRGPPTNNTPALWYACAEKCSGGRVALASSCARKIKERRSTFFFQKRTCSRQKRKNIIIVNGSKHRRSFAPYGSNCKLYS